MNINEPPDARLNLDTSAYRRNSALDREPTMDIFDSRYFVINKRLLTLGGLWPNERPHKKYLKRTFVVVAMIAMVLPHIIGIIVNHGADKRILLEHIGTIMLISLTSLKIVSSIVYEHKLALLYDAIASNWTAIVDPHELRILGKYSEMGRIITLGWIAYLAVGLITFITLPLSPIMLDIVKPLNASRPKLYIMNGEFLIDRERNYGKIYAYDSVATTVTAFIFASCDPMYAACIEHCLGLFAIIKYRLQMPIKLIVNKHQHSKYEDPAYDWMLQIIRLHSQILKFTVTLESTYERSFFAIVGVNLIYCSLLCVLTLLQGDNILNFIRYLLLCTGASVHLFYLSWPGQKLIDHSSGLHREAYLNQWYESSARTKTLLNFFMQRCSKPSLLTAGGLYVMNYNNFLMVMKKSISFMAVFSSFQ